jgi:ABC-2 type transport system permease protein
VVNLFSGALVPFSYLPHWLGTAATLSPFAGMASTPGLILVGTVTGYRAVTLITLQLAWVVVMWAGAKLLWRVGVRRISVTGG